MSQSFVTIATFSTPNEAVVAQHALVAEGIEAILTDEATVGMLWHLGNAVGGIKLQVPSDVADRAIDVLESAVPVEIGEDDWRTTGHPERAADDDDFEEEPEHEEIPDSDDVALNNDRTQDISRAMLAAVFGLLFCPLHVYALMLLAKVATSSEPLRKGDGWRILIALSLSSVYLIAFAIFMLSGP